MTDAMLVLNAGSSSIKFSLYAAAAADLELLASGQVGGIGTAPVVVARDAGGQPLVERRLDDVVGGHDGALVREHTPRAVEWFDRHLARKGGTETSR